MGQALCCEHEHYLTDVYGRLKQQEPMEKFHLRETKQVAPAPIASKEWSLGLDRCVLDARSCVHHPSKWLTEKQ